MSSVEIPLSGIRGAGKSAFVSPCDADLADKKWNLASDGYARRKASIEEESRGSPKNIAMHRQVLGLHLSLGGPSKMDVDHIDGNKLNNCRENLRLVSRSENNFNRHGTVGASRFVGVSFFKPAKLWRAYITLNGTRIELGYFKTEEDAAEARDKFCDQHVPTARMNRDRANG